MQPTSSSATAATSDDGEPAAAAPVAKRITAGTHRSRTLRETLDLVLPLLDRFGITRVADVTGLDHIGIPVVMVCRPNGKSLSVSQGKGLTMDAATASGVMESIETHHAENIQLPIRLDTHRKLRRVADVVDLDLIANVAHSTFHDDKRIPWVEARGLRSGATSWVPLELIDLDLTLPQTYARHCFASSSNGLASGNHRLEAIAHALSEVIERDSHALWALGKGRAGDDTQLDLATIDDPGCREVLERFRGAGIQVTVWDSTGEMGVPCFVSRITDARINAFRRIPAAEGAGCHPDRRVAMMRALTEAAQSRLTTIAGSRDDKPVEVYRDLRSGSYLQATNDEHHEADRDRSFHAVRSIDQGTFDEDVRCLVSLIEGLGLPEPLWVDLTQEPHEIPVVKVIAPGLEQKPNGPGALPGPRARRRLAELDAEVRP